MTAEAGLMEPLGEGRPLLSVQDLESRLVFTKCKVSNFKNPYFRTTEEDCGLPPSLALYYKCNLLIKKLKSVIRKL